MFNKIYDSGGEPGSFCDMEDIEDTKDFYEYKLITVDDVYILLPFPKFSRISVDLFICLVFSSGHRV